MAEVTVKGSYMVTPSKPTWEGVFPLSEWDQTGVITHVPTIYFYKPSEEWLRSSKSFMDTLKESLSRVLVHFYPLAGRLQWIGRGRLQLLCNAKGVELIEAESSSELSELGDFASNTSKFKNLIPWVDYDDKPMDELPLVLGQLTSFRCGGVSLGVTISHVVADGQSALHFMTEWARLARGEPLESPPYIDHTILRAPEVPNPRCDEYTEFYSPPLLIGKENNHEERMKPTTVAILPLEKHHVKRLKRDANKDLDHQNAQLFSRYEVVAAHVWRSACKARALQSEQATCLAFSIDVRGRLHPPLPHKYFGNAIIDVLASAKAGDIMTRPLSYTCGRIREALRKVNDEYVWANIEFLKSLPDFSLIQDLHSRKSKDSPFFGNPNIGVISWLTLPIYGLDFGWGNEIYMGPGTHDSDGDCLMLPGPVNDGSVKIALSLQEAHMDAFKRYLYQDIDISCA